MAQIQHDSITLFPDTNCFLHYPPMFDIDWCGVVSSNAVQLIVCLQVIHELDEKKGDSRLGDRARRAISEIAKFRGKAIRPGVILNVFNRDIRSDEFPALLNIESKDDRILHSARIYAQEHADELVSVITEDLGMVLRCEAGGFGCLQMDASLRLENPTTQLEKDYKRAIVELHALKTQKPAISFWLTPYGDNTQRSTPFAITLGDDGAEPLNFDKEDARIRTEYPPMGQTYGEVFNHAEAGLPAISPTDRLQYNQALEKYYANHLKWCEEYNAWVDRRRHAFMFNLVVVNAGRMPGEDIEIVIRFPDLFETVVTLDGDEAKPFRVPEEPEPPEKPSLGLVAARTAAIARSYTGFDYTTAFSPMSNVAQFTGPIYATVRHNNSNFEVVVTVANLKHNYEVAAAGFVAKFNDNVHPRTFEAEYSLTAANVPDCNYGKVCFLLPKEQLSHQIPA